MSIAPRGKESPQRTVGQKVVLSDYFTTNQFRPMRGALRKTALVIPMLLFAFAMQAQDLSVAVRSSVTTATIGSPVTFTVVVKNDGATAASGVTVTSAVPTGSTYVSDDGGTAYNSGTGLWTVGGIAAGDSAKLNITVTVASEGVVFSQVEVTASSGIDPDSTPGNGSVIEDDWASSCTTVPMHYNCRDDINVLATAPSGYANYQWYLNGAPIAGATQDTYRIRGVGDFTFTAETMGTSCPASLCCPISVVRDSCMSLGNLVFEDKDNNGLFDGADAGLNGVEVQLWSAGLNGVKGGGDDVLDSTITTANGGLYLFTNLNPGIYFVKLTGIGVPTDYVSSTGGGINDNDGSGTSEPGSSDETIDSDDNGSKMVGSSMIMSDLIPLTLNGEPTSEDGSANSNLTIDFGLYKPVCVAPDLSVTAPPAAICSPGTFDLASVTLVDNNSVSGAITYYATAGDAAVATNALGSSVVTTSGTYWIRKEGSFAPCFDTVSVVITINPKPDYNYVLSSICSGQSIDLTTNIVDYVSIVNPVWTMGSATGTVVSTPASVSPTASTDYYLVGENAFGCKDTTTNVVTVSPKPNAGSDKLLVCNGAVAPTTYDFAQTGTWSVLTQPATASASISGAGVASAMTVAGDYEFVLDINGCKDTVKVTIPACSCTSPDLSATSPAAVCAPNTIDLASITVTDAAGINNTLSYYSTSSDAVAGTNAMTSTVISASGTYWIRMAGDAAPCYDTVSVVITINPKPVYADGLTTVCEGTVVNLTSLVVDYANIVNPTWKEGVNAVADATAVTPSVGATTYTLTGENATGCKDTAEVVVTVNPLPNAGADTSLVCSGNVTPSTVNFNQTGTWSVLTQPVGASASIDGTGNATGMTVGGQYTFELVINGCKDTVVVTVTPCIPTLSLGNLVWADTNNDGIKDAAENGIPGVEVQLWNVGGNGVKDPIGGDDFMLTSQNTDGSGNYLFTGMTDGIYYVKLTGVGVPAGMVSSTGGGVTDNDGAGTYEPSNVVDVNETDNGSQMAAMIMSNAVTLQLNTEPTNDGDNSPNSNLTVDFGLYTPPASLGNLVWEDTNNNGTKDPTEGGIAGVEVVLYNLGTNGIKDGDDVAVDTLVTDANGNYLFTGLTAGDYYVKLSGLGVPTGMVSSTGDGATDTDGIGAFEPSTSSADNSDNGTEMGAMIMSLIENLSAGEVDTTVDFGLYKPVIVPDTLYVTIPVDSTTNPLCATGDDLRNIASSVVTTCEPDGQTDFGTWTTDANGCAVYTAGSIPGNTVDTLCVVGTDSLGRKDTTVWIITITPNVTASLGNLVWEDTNNNGTKDPTEGGIAGVEVVLYNLGTNGIKDGDDVAVDTMVTDANGNYLFTGLTAGDYYVKLSGLGVPTGMVSSTGDGATDTDGIGAFEPSTSTADNSDNGTEMGAMVMSSVTNLTQGEVDTTVDFGLYKPVIVPDTMYVTIPVDSTTNPLCATGDDLRNIASSVVTTCEPDGQTDFGTWTTDANGCAVYTAGSIPGNTVDTLCVVGTDSLGRKDTTVWIITITPKLSIGNLVWLDDNNNGTKDANENGLGGIQVILYSSLDGTKGNADDVAVDTMVTDVNGNYLFNGLAAGNYWVKLNNLPSSLKSSTGDGIYDNDGLGTFEPSTVVDQNEQDNGSQMGTMVMSQLVVLSVNGEPTTDGDTDANTNLTVDFGLYVPQLLPTLTLGNLVWNDADNNGIKDANEAGLNNVQMILYATTDTIKGNADDVAVDTVFTDINGNYRFEGLAEGKYWVKINAVPTGMVSSTGGGIYDNDNAGTFEPSTVVDQNNTDNGTAMGTMVMSKIVDLALNTEPTNDDDADANTNLTVDFGLYTPTPLLSIGNLVWLDSDNNGVKDANENGLSNVEVILYSTTDTIKGNGDDIAIDTLATDINGNYLFSGLIAGNYWVKLNNVPTGLKSSTGDGPTDNDNTGTYEPSSVVDANNTDNGTAMGTMVMSQIVNLVANAEPTTDGDTDANTNLTVDFGLYVPQAIACDCPTRQDTIAPMFVNVPANVTVECSNVPTIPTVSATDNCDTSVVVTVAQVRTDGNCPDSYTLTRTWTATDDCGNTATALQVVTVQDTTKPVLANVPANVTLSCPATMPTALPTATDNCDTNVRITMTDVTTPSACAGNYVVTRTWTATDNCSNTATASQVITVRDTVAPVIAGVPANITLSCEMVVPMPATPSVTDACDANASATMTQTRVDGNCVNSYTLIRRWTATDACGNTATASQVITVEDRTAPSLVGVPSNITLNCGDTAPAAPSVSATDNCGGAAVSMVQTTPTASTIVRTWTATDSCGNTSTASQTITLPTNCNGLSLGNLVWRDTDNNGIKDGNEQGIVDVQVQLFSSTDTIKGNADDVLVGTQLTDINGNYSFTGLSAGKYWVKLTGVGLPTGFISSTGDGPFDADGAGSFEPSTEGDVNERDHGTQMGTMIMSKIVDLALNSEPTNDGDADANSNLTVDFGIYKPTPLPTLSIGNLVWLDSDNDGIKDANETGLGGVTVVLYDAGSNGIKDSTDIAIDTLTTDVNGNYLFAGLNEGSYFVKLTGLPTSLVSSTGDGPYDADNAGSFEPSTEGDVNERDHGTGMANTGMVMSQVVNLTRYAEPTNDGDADVNTNLTVDFGLYTPAIQPVFDLALIKKLAPRPRGVVVNNGDVVRFNMTVVNQGNQDAYDVKISDYIPAGLQFNVAANTAALTGNANNWQADSTLVVGDIAAGQSKVVGIFLTINHAPNDTIFVNKSEILFATDTQGSGVNTLDVDSRADRNPNNDIVGGDDILNNFRNDEDDHDFAYVIDYIDHDPIGYIYCDKTGKILTGGQIDVTGPGLVFYIERGETGRYQFYTDGTPGTYTISYSHPDGYPMSSICAPQADTLNTSTADGSSIDKDGVANGTTVIGSGANAGFMLDKTCANNPYYTHINITSGSDPIVLNNNLPVQCSFIGALTCSDNNYNSIIDAGDTRIDSVKVYLLNCTTLAVIDSTISINGQYRFDGLRNGSYRIRAVLPTGYRYSIANVGGNEAVDSDVDSLGYSACINLQFGECDTTNAQVCFIPNIYELDLRKTLAAGQNSVVGVGDTVTFNIQVRNTGSMDAYDVDVTDELPTHLTLIDNNWTLVGTNAVRRIPFIAFGGTANVTIRTKVNAQTVSILNTASVRGASVPNGPQSSEVTLTNNRDSVRITLRACALTPDFVMNNACATEGSDFDVIGSYATWAWNFGDGTTSTLENPSHTYQAGGTYSVSLTVTDTVGCTGTITKQVIIHPMVWAYAGIDRTICAGDSVHLHAQGGTHYLWLTGTSSLDDTISANPVARPSVTTTYVVAVSNDYGCFTLDTVVVNVVPVPVIVSRTGNLSTCTNGVMPASITIDQPITSYEIVGSAGWRNVVVNGNTITFDAVLNGSYNNLRVILRGANGCSVTDEFNLYLAGNPRADFVAVEPFCNGNDITLLFTGQATPGANLNYTSADGVVVYRSAATATRPLGDTTIIRFPDLGSKLITLTVNDGGCTDTKVQSIYVRKTPVVTITTPDQTVCPNTCVQLNATTTLPGMIMWTANQTPSGLSAADIMNPMACPTQTTTYVLTVMEAGGCMGRDSVTITVNNNTPVLIGVPANVTVACGSIPTAPTVTEQYGATVRLTETRTNGNCEGNYTLTRTWTATDVCNRTVTGTQVITVQDLVAPVLANVPANITVTCTADVPTAATLTATDACNTAAPTVTVNDVVSNETCVNRKTITRTWTATDACGNSATGVQVITVNDNVAPVLAGVPANVTITCNGDMPTAPTVTATDNCTGGTPTVSMAEATTNEVCVNRKTVTRTWTATDACGNTATATQVITVNDNVAPVFTSIPADITLECDETQPNVLAVATDNCGTPTITIANTTNGSGCSYTISRVFTATDACGNTAKATQTITVRDSKAPIITNVPANVTVDCEASIPAISTPSVSDACDQSPRLTMTQATTDSTCHSRKTVVRTWTATDACGNTSTASQAVRINDNVAPVITPTNPRLAGFNSGDTLTLSCEDIQIFQMGDATAVDNCDGVLTPNSTRFRFEDLARQRGNCLTDGYSLLIECRWYAVDRCGNESEWRIFLKVTDNKVPVMSGCPANVTVASPSAIPTAPIVTATDNCTDSVRVTLAETTTPTGNNCDYLITRTWTATDACGNFATCRQIITVQDSLSVKFVYTDATCVGNDGTISMIPTQGLNYAWSDGGTGANRTNLRPGTYTVTASRGTCQKVLTITIGDNCQCVTPIATVQKADATCGNANGTATIVVDNMANYTFTWSSGGANTNSRTGLAAGNYSVTVSRIGVPNCQTVASFTINNNTQGCCTPPVATIQKTDATCGTANGTATVVVDNAANYTYTWSDGNTAINRTGLAAGNYTVTVSRIGVANCTSVVAVTIGNNTANCCTDYIAQTSIVKVITDCNSNADVCVEIPSNSIATYTITDNGAPYTAGFGTCLAGSTLYFGSGDHTVIFTSPTGCKDTLLVKVVCTPELVINRTVAFPQTDSTCLTATQLGLTGTIVSVVNECAGSEDNTSITIDPTSHCINYKSLSVGIDTACLRVTTSTGGSATVKLIITVNLPACGSIIPQDSVVVTDACTANPKVCVNIPYDVIPDYDILLNGVTYTGGLDGCKNDTSFAYTYFTIPGRGATGPYTLDYWTVNGVTYTAPTVNNMDELVVLMNAWDPTGHWMLSSSTLTIIGGDRTKSYGAMKMTRISNAAFGIMQLNTNIIPLATTLDIPRGHSTLVFINQNTGCADTLMVNAACLTPQYIESSMYIGDKDTMCIVTNELMGTRYRLSKLVASTNTYARFTDLSGTTCVSRTGVAVGVEKAVYVISDEFGLNDTTYVTTYVFARAVKRPKAFTDYASTIKTQPVLIDVLSNDSLNTNSGKVKIVAQPKHGEVIVTADMRVIYTPDVDYCSSAQPDVFTYELCNNGGCDTAIVEVTVSCDKIKIYNGFSPNGDGVNDYFVIEGIENFKDNTVSVFNRWGTQVMTTKGYKNDWNGKWDNVDLPDGTYFYIFNDGEGNIKSGYVQIQR